MNEPKAGKIKNKVNRNCVNNKAPKNRFSYAFLISKKSVKNFGFPPKTNPCLGAGFGGAITYSTQAEIGLGRNNI